MNVPESKETVSSKKKEDDEKFCCDKLEFDTDDFVECWRAGKVDETKEDYCRPLVVKMIDEQTVNDFTRNGRGMQTDSGYWINKDLCAADRRANFLARQERKKRLARSED